MIISFFSCDKNKSKVPSIAFVSISQSFMVQNAQDSAYLRFSFSDGDGDLGSDTDDNVFVKDSRTGAVIAKFRIPNYTGNQNNSAREGEVTVIVYPPCCIYPDSTSCTPSTVFPTRKMKYLIQVIDEAGNYSNEIETDEITLDCL